MPALGGRENVLYDLRDRRWSKLRIRLLRAQLYQRVHRNLGPFLVPVSGPEYFGFAIRYGFLDRWYTH